MGEAPVAISVVLPVYNEVETLPELLDELTRVMERQGESFEIVAVDDGSNDGSFQYLRERHAADPRLRVVRLARNFGQNPALYAGFDHVRGEIIVTLDADGQNPPDAIPTLIAKLREGYDLVQGWREMRQDNAFRKTASRGVNLVVNRLTRMNLHDLGTSLKAYRRETIEQLKLSRHRSRYIPAETAWLGARVAEVPVGHRPRQKGASKYNLWALLRVNFDMIASISTAPVQLIGLVGGVFSVVGFVMALRIAILRIIYGNFNELATVAAMFFFLVGIQMLCMAVLCEYVSRIYREVQQRPYYIVGEVLE